jgi:putative N6-adenine-specific DNA methylase
MTTPATPPRPRPLERALKRQVWSAQHPLQAHCAPGLEPLLLREIERLPGVQGVLGDVGRVDFEAPFDTLLDALLTLRSAQGLRLLLLHGGAALTFPMLFDRLTRVPWTLWIPDGAPLQVRVRSRKSRLRDDAGLERTLRQALRHAGIHPGLGPTPALTLQLELDHDRASVALDVGGALHRRRHEKWVAPTTIRETTAAALALLAGLEGRPPDLLVDPFCGSGTLVVEALAILEGRPIGRERLPPLAHSPAWKGERWTAALRRADAGRRATTLPRVLASDTDPQALRAADHNLRAWGYREAVELRATPAQRLDLAGLARAAGAQRPLLLSNPPYGKGASGWGGAPEALLATLLGRAHGWRFALLTPHAADLARLPGVVVEASHPLTTGGLRNAITLGRVTGP